MKKDALEPRGAAPGTGGLAWSENEILFGGVPLVELAITDCQCEMEDGQSLEDPWLLPCSACSAGT